MTDTQRARLELELEYVNNAIDEFKLEDAAIKMARAELLPVTQLRQDEVINMNTNQRDASI